MQDLWCAICHRAHAEADRVGSSRQFAKGLHRPLLDLGLPYLSPKYRGGACNQADGAGEEQEESMRLIFTRNTPQLAAAGIKGIGI